MITRLVDAGLTDRAPPLAPGPSDTNTGPLTTPHLLPTQHSPLMSLSSITQLANSYILALTNIHHTNNTHKTTNHLI